jgi:hypothetical protein
MTKVRKRFSLAAGAVLGVLTAFMLIPAQSATADGCRNTGCVGICTGEVCTSNCNPVNERFCTMAAGDCLSVWCPLIPE